MIEGPVRGYSPDTVLPTAKWFLEEVEGFDKDKESSFWKSWSWRGRGTDPLGRKLLLEARWFSGILNLDLLNHDSRVSEHLTINEQERDLVFFGQAGMNLPGSLISQGGLSFKVISSRNYISSMPVVGIFFDRTYQPHQCPNSPAELSLRKIGDIDVNRILNRKNEHHLRVFRSWEDGLDWVMRVKNTIQKAKYLPPEDPNRAFDIEE